MDNEKRNKMKVKLVADLGEEFFQKLQKKISIALEEVDARWMKYKQHVAEARAQNRHIVCK